MLAHIGDAFTRLLSPELEGDALLLSIYEGVRLELDFRPVLYLVAPEDDRRRELGAMLEGIDHDVRALASGEELRQALRVEPADVILLDDSGAADALELCAELKDHQRWGLTPVVLAIEDHDPQARDRAFSAQADEVMIHPLDATQLGARIQALSDRVWNCVRATARHNRPGVAASAVAEGEQPIRVLLAEESEPLRQILRHAMGWQLGWVVDEAPDGEAALELLRREGYDFVLLDLALPRRDGMRLLEEIRSQNLQPGAALLGLTSVTNAEVLERGYAMGLDDLIRKPLNPDLLIARMQRFLKRDAA